MKYLRLFKVSIIAICILACLTMFVMLSANEVFATEQTANVTANCDITTVKSGDEVRIKVSTKAMKISTFIASVGYDSDVLEYVGYEGCRDKTAYLEEANNPDSHFVVTVEKSESGPFVGMYAIGTTEKKYAAAEPLVTLVFKAMNDGEVRYAVSESSSGSDGYTSESIEQKSQPDEQVPVDEDEKNVSFNWKYGIAIIGVLAICVLVIIMRKRKEK